MEKECQDLRENQAATFPVIPDRVFLLVHFQTIAVVEHKCYPEPSLPKTLDLFLGRWSETILGYRYVI